MQTAAAGEQDKQLSSTLRRGDGIFREEGGEIIEGLGRVKEVENMKSGKGLFSEMLGKVLGLGEEQISHRKFFRQPELSQAETWAGRGSGQGHSRYKPGLCLFHGQCEELVLCQTVPRFCCSHRSHLRSGQKSQDA